MKAISRDQYLKILGVDKNAGMEELKKAYRKKVRLYHPDLNSRDDAAEIFIMVNEAYEYLTEQLTNMEEVAGREELIREWQEYRRAEARKRAYKHSKVKYAKFTKSKFYKTSMVLNKAQLFANLSVAILIITMAVIGYIDKWNMVANKGHDPPSLIVFIFLLLIGAIFFIVSLAHIMAFYQNTRNTKQNEKKNK